MLWGLAGSGFGCDGLQPAHDGLRPAHDGLQPAHDGLQPAHDGLIRDETVQEGGRDTTVRVVARDDSSPEDVWGPRRFLGLDPPEAAILTRLHQAPPWRFKPVGSSSIVLKMYLRDGFDGAFKVPSRSREHADVAEIAAYRVARALGMDNVPPAVSRRVPRSTLERCLHPKFTASWSDLRAAIRWDAHANVMGAAIFWVAGMKPLSPNAPRRLKALSHWIEGPEGPPDAQRTLAADLSTMLAFDYLIGNWDRFSGANLKLDTSERRLVVRDHDVAFPMRLSPEVHRRILDRVLRVRRFSRTFVENLTALDTARLQTALAGDPRGGLESWLNAHRLQGWLDRRATLLSHIGALMREEGAHAVLVFP